MKLKLIALLGFFISFYFVATPPSRAEDNESKTKIIHGQVIKIITDRQITLPNGDKQREQYIEVKLSDGDTIDTLHSIPPSLLYRIILQKGDQIILTQEDEIYYVESFAMDWVCWLLVGLLCLLVLVIGRIKGVLALISLLVKGSLLFLVVIPALKEGYSPLLISSLFCTASAFLTISLVSGWNLKTLSACLGTILGVIVAGLIGSWAVNASRISGLFEPEMQSLFYLFPKIKITELISAGVLIGSLGAAMDVAISVASALYEVHLAAPEKKTWELYRIGMNIGQDVMGTMVNTLILAYAGSAIATLILITQLNLDMLLNNEILVREIILSVVGSVGLILTIPFTALLSSFFYSQIERENDRQESIIHPDP
ncbi:MAG: YibE/F family protein [Candidatus Caenarcaniphilales bacterium]|nr:YibE/F family protein [Candidatus Caenarcaniphilales bacterium]